MTRELICVLKKDLKEYLRSKKNIYFVITLLLIGIMILGTTIFFPSLVSALAEKAPDMITDTKSLDSMMANLFPSDLKGSYGIWASDVGIFYGIIIILMTQGLIMVEVKNGKWVMPVASGYSKKSLLISKCIIYGMGAAFPVFVLSNAFYFAALSVLETNIQYFNVFIASVLLSFTMASIVVITMLSSILCKHSMSAGFSMILIVMVAPDIMTYFSFGKYLPTYLLTYVYTMSNHVSELVIPILELIILFFVLLKVAQKKVMTIEISR